MAAQTNNNLSESVYRRRLDRWRLREPIGTAKLNQPINVLDGILLGVALPRVIRQITPPEATAVTESDQLRFAVIIGPSGCAEDGTYAPALLNRIALTIRQVTHKPPAEPDGPWSGIWLLSGDIETVYCWPGLKASAYLPLFYPKDVNQNPVQNEEVTDNVTIVPVVWYDGRWVAVQQPRFQPGSPNNKVPRGDCAP